MKAMDTIPFLGQQIAAIRVLHLSNTNGRAYLPQWHMGDSDDHAVHQGLRQVLLRLRQIILRLDSGLLRLGLIPHPLSAAGLCRPDEQVRLQATCRTAMRAKMPTWCRPASDAGCQLPSCRPHQPLELRAGRRPTP